LIARGVPNEFVTIATEKVATISKAYDTIAKMGRLTTYRERERNPCKLTRLVRPALSAVSGSTPLRIDVKRQLNANALNVVGGCFGNEGFHVCDARVSAVAHGAGRLLVLIKQCAFPDDQTLRVSR